MRADRGTRVLSTKPEEAGVGDAEVRPDQEAQGGPILLTGSGETCCLLQPWAQREGILGVPLGGTRRVGGLFGVAGRLSGTVSP